MKAAICRSTFTLADYAFVLFLLVSTLTASLYRLVRLCSSAHQMLAFIVMKFDFVEFHWRSSTLMLAKHLEGFTPQSSVSSIAFLDCINTVRHKV